MSEQWGEIKKKKEVSQLAELSPSLTLTVTKNVARNAHHLHETGSMSGNIFFFFVVVNKKCVVL